MHISSASEERMAPTWSQWMSFVMNFWAGSIKLNDGVLSLGVETLCPTLCWQRDVVDILIVHGTIESAQRRIGEIVGTST